MQIGVITVDGRQVGLVSLTQGNEPPDSTFRPNVDGFAPEAPSRSLDASTHTGGRAGSGGHHQIGHARVGEPQQHEPGKAHGPTTVGKGEDPRGMESHIRAEASKHNVDPDTAVAVAKSEGLKDFSGDKNTSFGAFQLHKRGGLGDEFQKETGLDPADPANEKATISWAMKNLGRTGWTPYHGAHNRYGMGKWDGIGNNKPTVGASEAKIEPGASLVPDAAGAERRGSANLMHGQYGAPGTNLTKITTPSGHTATVHSEAAPGFSGFLNELEGSGYKVHSLGGYADRNIRGGSGLSQHAYGNAIDINPEQNPQHGGTNMPANVSDMAAKWGLTWGGDWSARSRDPMHFEWTGRRPWQNPTAAKPAAKTAGFDPETMVP